MPIPTHTSLHEGIVVRNVEGEDCIRWSGFHQQEIMLREEEAGNGRLCLVVSDETDCAVITISQLEMVKILGMLARWASGDHAVVSRAIRPLRADSPSPPPSPSTDDTPEPHRS